MGDLLDKTFEILSRGTGVYRPVAVKQIEECYGRLRQSLASGEALLPALGLQIILTVVRQPDSSPVKFG